jgi:hypothetical protein
LFVIIKFSLKVILSLKIGLAIEEAIINAIISIPIIYLFLKIENWMGFLIKTQIQLLGGQG